MSTVQTTNIKNAASASNNITLDASGNVGVGTAAPGYKLDVSGTLRSTGLATFDNAISLSTASLNYLYYTSALAFAQTGTGERMRITAAGNVGIGTSSPASLLQVAGTVRFGAGPGDATNASVAMYSDGSGVSIEAFQGNAVATKRNMWLNAYGGNVGIGTASPGYLFTVNGQAAFNQIILPGSVNYVTAPAAGSVIAFQTAGIDRAAILGNGDFQFNSGYGSSATAYGCRAWVNFNGTGTVAIRGSGNVSSITDNGVGVYTVNFTTAMPDVNYSVAASSGGAVGYVLTGERIETLTTGSVRIVILGIVGSTQADVDSGSVFVAIFR